MKAIRYVEIYHNNIANGMSEPDAVKVIVLQLTNEISSLAKERNVKTNDGLCGVVREVINKWKAIARKLNFNQDGFEPFLEKHTGLRVTPFGLEEIKGEK